MRGTLLFDIDGVIRDVSGSYRLAIQQTVFHFTKWNPSIEDIDKLKAEGCWNNDWDTSLELIKRHRAHLTNSELMPHKNELIKVFNSFYFGNDPIEDPQKWQGLINNESLLVTKSFFEELSLQGFAWGFVSGAERPSANFLLKTRLGLKNPPLVAMGEAPEKPNPQGLLQLAKEITNDFLGSNAPPIAYLGDTVADILTIKRAREVLPDQKFISLAVAPPHLHMKGKEVARADYEKTLREYGADHILKSTSEAIDKISDWKD